MFRLRSHRKKEFVSRAIQGRVMLQVGLYWGLYHLFLWHAMFLFRYAQMRLTSSMTEVPMSMQEMYGQFVRDFYPLAVCAIGTLPIVMVDMMKLTHRIAGPLVRIRRALRELAEGKKVEPFQLREGDLLTELQDDLNAYLATLTDEAVSSRRAASDEAYLAREIDELSHSVQQLTQVAPIGEQESEPDAVLATCESR